MAYLSSSCRRRILNVAICFLPLFAMTGLRGSLISDERPQVTLSEVIEGLLTWQRNATSLRVEVNTLDREDMKLIDSSFPLDASLVAGEWGLHTTLWSEQPFRFWFRHENVMQGAVEARQVGAVDGFQYWIGHSSGGSMGDENVVPLTHLEVLSLHPMATPMHYVLWSHPMRDYCRIPALKGLWHEGRCCWVGDWLGENGTARVIGSELVDGVLCVVVKALYQEPGTVGNEVSEQWWFDPAVQYLPRRYVRTGPAVNVFGEMRSLPIIWKVDEFRKIRDNFWFPQTGTYTREYIRGRTGRLTTQSFEWIVLDVTLDQPIPVERLLPPEPTEETMIYANDFDPSASTNLSRGWRDSGVRAQRATAAWFLDPAILLLSSVFAVGGCVILWQRLRQKAALSSSAE